MRVRREAGTPSGGVSSSSGGGGIAHAPRSQTLVMASAVPADEARSIQRRMRGAAVELGVIGLCGNFLSVSGIAHLPAMLAEVFLGTVHIFVPLCSVALGGAAAVGARARGRRAPSRSPPSASPASAARSPPADSPPPPPPSAARRRPTSAGSSR